MGGRSALIYGTLSGDRLAPAPAKRSMIDRVLGRNPFERPRESHVGNDRTLIDIPADALTPLMREFVGFVRRSLPKPWTATKSMLQYLNDIRGRVYVRGEKLLDAEPDWYLQLSFSGCAGMAEVSALIATHWAEIWFSRQQFDLVRTFLAPFGFIPSDEPVRQRVEDGFVPLGTFGYARFDRSGRASSSDDLNSSSYFEIDACFLDGADALGAVIPLRRLDVELLPRLPSGTCWCQMCQPELNTQLFDEISSGLIDAWKAS